MKHHPPIAATSVKSAAQVTGERADRKRRLRPHPERLTDKANRKKAGDFGPVT
jgi:hypothetical protein